jgi:hypothetical protein
MKKIILIITLLTPLHLQADHHTISGPGEGAFNALVVQAHDVAKYVNLLKADLSLFKALGATAGGVCITRSGHDYEGQIADEYFAGASWGRIWEKSRTMIDEVISDTYELCEQIYSAE